MDNPPSPFAEPAGEQVPVAERLEAVERRLREVAHRLDQLEGSVTEVMAAENHGLLQEVRHTMSELGRLIVKDLGRLSKLIERDHRQLLDALTPPEPPLTQTSDPDPPPPGEAVEAPGPDQDDEARRPVVIITDDADQSPAGQGEDGDGDDDEPGADSKAEPEEASPRRRRGPFRARRS